MELDHWVLSAIGVKSLVYLFCLLSAGTALFKIAIDKRAVLIPNYAKMIIITASVGALATIVQVLVRAGLIIDDGFAGMFDPEFISLALEGSNGTAISARLLGVVLLIIGAITQKFQIAFFVIAALIVTSSFALVGHATDVAPLLLGTIITIHLFAVSFWIGALYPLYYGSKSVPSETIDLAHTFGTVSVYTVGSLVIAGIAFIVFRFGSPFALIDYSYGDALLWKFGGVLVLLFLAAVNKLVFVLQMDEGKAGAAQSLRHSIMVEAICFSFIFTVTAYLTTATAIP